MDPTKPSTPSSDTETETKLNTGDTDSSPMTPTEASASEAATKMSAPKAPETPAADATMSSADGDSMPASMGDTAAPAPSDPMAAPKPKKKRLMMALLAGAAVLVLGGGASAAYFGYVVPNKPENVLKSALGNLFTGKMSSAYMDGSFGVTDKASNQTITATLTGKTSSTGDLEVSVEADAVVTKATIDMRSVDGDLYFKVGGLNGLPELMEAAGDPTAKQYAPLLAMLNDQWFVVNKSLLNQIGLNLNSKASEADMQKLAQLYEQHPFLTVKQKMADETIKGMASYHYKVVVDKDGLKQFIQGVIDAKLDAFKNSKNALTELKKSLDNDKTDLSKYPVEVWISKDKKFIDQIKFTISDSEASGDMRITFFDFNKPVTVEKPAGAKSILEVISAILGDGGDTTTLMNQLNSGGISL